jgi:hypothetical protein
MVGEHSLIYSMVVASLPVLLPTTSSIAQDWHLASHAQSIALHVRSQAPTVQPASPTTSSPTTNVSPLVRSTTTSPPPIPASPVLHPALTVHQPPPIAPHAWPLTTVSHTTTSLMCVMLIHALLRTMPQLTIITALYVTLAV